MENQATTLATLFRQALVNPMELSISDIDRLLTKYPYSQPLYFAKERRKFLNSELNSLDSRAVLLTSSPSWLYDYVQMPVEEAPVLEAVDTDYVPYESDPADEVPVETPALEEAPVLEVVDTDYVPYESDPADEVPVETPAVEEVTDEVEEVEQSSLENLNEGEESEEQAENTDQEEALPPLMRSDLDDEPEASGADEAKALDDLVQVGIGGGDFFALHAKESVSSDHEVSDVAEVEAEASEEDISLYNDDLMPYSFRWWLHKTRLAYADTYQPFANLSAPAVQEGNFTRKRSDEVVLDQQIRENIIHLQAPEDKLSEAVKQKEVFYTRVDKTAKVIEKFIQEEPQIQPPQADQLNTENKARKSSEEQYDLVTETLANIYANQTMYVKAIEVYKKLILKFPEKKSYFASQIKSLEEKLY